ncbi:MAG: PQQ-binding-like beta-propeller repeat protein [Planctomycetes bacterium]|nr:PQQ-binding-like beta-propeller repeat protein [Planctomycetota bacterium]
MKYGSLQCSCLAFLLAALLASIAPAEDWPAYRHDLARSGVTSEPLPTPLHLQWVHQPAHAPMPAWPEPGRELNRVDFDYVYRVTAAGGIATFGSSADHKVYAIDLKTGKERWSFFTGGPVRFAPAIEGDRVFAASDDGYVYCLDAKDGKPIWRFYGGPRQEKVFGNGQMISRWPLRSGVAVEKGIVYLSAGMWPNEGVYLYALSAKDGKVLWENDTSGTMYVKQPHPGSFAMTGVTPQGYVFGEEGRIFIPTGRNVPAAYDRKTGELSYYRSQPTSWSNRWGGCWNFLAEGFHFNWVCHVGRDIDVMMGEYPPDPKDGMVVFDSDTGKERRELYGKLYAVVKGGILYAAGAKNVTAYDLNTWVEGGKPEDCIQWDTEYGRAYSIIMAGDTIIVGGQGNIAALNAKDGKILWQDDVNGQARGLAVADGGLLVSTTTGDILCYGGKAVKVVPTITRTPDASALEGDLAIVKQAERIIHETGKTAGYCLSIGSGDGKLLYALARQSGLQIQCIEPDAQKAASVRKALDDAGVYGVQVTVDQGTLESIQYPDYFADLILLGDGTADRLTPQTIREIYRVLHPCGGMAFFTVPEEPEGQANALKTRLVESGVPEGEIVVFKTSVHVVRGKLPDAGNWTHEYASAARTGSSTDQRVRLPVKLLWFGKPGPMRIITRHWRGPAPLCVDGRMFVIGQFSVMGVDAYNGRQLWRRDLPSAGRWPMHSKGNCAAADANSVFLATQTACLRFDAATGETMQTYPLPAAPDDVVKEDLPTAVWSYLAVTDNHILGSIGRNDTQGKCIFVLAKDGTQRWMYTADGIVTNNAIAMTDSRVYLLDKASAADVAKAKRRGKTITGGATLLCLDAATGKTLWQTREGLERRTSLWLGGDVLLASGGNCLTGFAATDGKVLYSRDVRMSKLPVIVGDTIYAMPVALDLRTGKEKTRIAPLTGEPTSWTFNKGYGCGAVSGGPNLLMFRSSTLGFYDLAGDTGVHNFGGVRAGCFINAIASNGLVLVPPSDAACTCSYSLRTTVALMPAKRDPSWSIFLDRLPTATVNRAALNLGAPGDRRDKEGTMWLAMPRPDTRARRPTFARPFRFTCREGLGPYRRNYADLKITGTSRPWIYGSGLSGIERAELDLNVLDQGYVAWPTEKAPKIDANLDDPCWDGYRALGIPTEDSTVTLRYDDQNLYVSYYRPQATDENGAPRPWKASAKDKETDVPKDDSFDLYFSNIPASSKLAATKCLHLAVSASGARYDAAWEYVSPFPTLDIPKVNVTIDGETSDWGGQGLKVQSLPGQRGKMRAPANFDPSLRIGWTEKGVAILAQVKDNAFHEGPNEGRLYMGDAVELFITPKIGTTDFYQLIVAPGADAKHPKIRHRFYDYRRTARNVRLTAEMASRKTADGYVIEVLLPWENLKIKPEAGRVFGMQFFADDSDADGQKPFIALWHPGGHPKRKRNPFAYQSFRLAEKPSQPLVFKRSEKPGPGGLYTLAPPLPFPTYIPPLGAKGEDMEYSGAWTCAAKADAKGFAAEMAIPWQTLTDAGLPKEAVMLDISARGPLRRAPMIGKGYERVILAPESLNEARRFTLRLHFAEIAGAKPGQRVFDVKVQGKTALTNFDIAKEAGGVNRAVVKDISDIVASRAIVLEFVPKAKQPDAMTAPILSAIEVLSEQK